MSQDAACKGNNMAETVVVNDGKLANVFVYVKDGLGDRTFDVPKDSVTIDQKGCQYHPHVLGVMTGQNIEIRNDDETTHNIHPTPKDNREWNESQPPKAAAIEKNFAREEIMLPVKCNQHPWMKMYVNVVKTPVLRGHRRRWQVRNQGPAAGRLHAGLRAGKAGRAGSESHAGRQRQQDGRPGLQTVSRFEVAPASCRLSGGHLALPRWAGRPPDSRRDGGAT